MCENGCTLPYTAIYIIGLVYVQGVAITMNYRHAMQNNYAPTLKS